MKKLLLFFSFVFIVATLFTVTASASAIPDDVAAALQSAGVDYAAETAGLSASAERTLSDALSRVDATEIDEELFRLFLDASQAISYEGIAARLMGDEPGIRSLYSTNEAQIEAVALRARILYGAVMGTAETEAGTVRSHADLTVGYTNGSAVAEAERMALVTLYDSMGGAANGKYASESASKKSFAFTTIYGDESQTEEMAKNVSLLYRGFVILVTEGKAYTLYFDAKGDVFGNASGTYGEGTTLYEATTYFRDVYVKNGEKPFAENALLSKAIAIAEGEYVPETLVTSVTYKMTDLIPKTADNTKTDGTRGYIDGTETYLFPNDNNKNSVTVKVTVPVSGIYKVSGKVALNGSARVDYLYFKNTTTSLERWNGTETVSRLETGKGYYTNASCIADGATKSATLTYQYFEAGVENSLSITVQSSTNKSPLGIHSLTFDLCGRDEGNYNGEVIGFATRGLTDSTANYTLTNVVDGQTPQKENSPNGVSVAYGALTFIKKTITIEKGGDYRLQTLAAIRLAPSNISVTLTGKNTGTVVTKNFGTDTVAKHPSTDSYFHIDAVTRSAVYADFGTVTLPKDEYTLTVTNKSAKDAFALPLVLLVAEPSETLLVDTEGNALSSDKKYDENTPPTVYGYTFVETVTETVEGMTVTKHIYERNTVTVKAKFVLDGEVVETETKTLRYGDAYTLWAPEKAGYRLLSLEGTAYGNLSLVGRYEKRTGATEKEIFAENITGGTLLSASEGYLATATVAKSGTLTVTATDMQSGIYKIYMKSEAMGKKNDIVYQNLSATTLVSDAVTASTSYAKWSSMKTMGRLQASESKGTTLQVSESTGYRLLGYQCLIEGDNTLTVKSGSEATNGFGIAALKLVKVSEVEGRSSLFATARTYSSASASTVATADYAGYGYGTIMLRPTGTANNYTNTSVTYTFDIAEDGEYSFSHLASIQVKAGTYITVTDASGRTGSLSLSAVTDQIGTAGASAVYRSLGSLMLTKGEATVTLTCPKDSVYINFFALSLLRVGEYDIPVPEKELSVGAGLTGGTTLPATETTDETLSVAKNGTLTATFPNMEEGAYALYVRMNGSTQKTNFTVKNGSATSIKDKDGATFTSVGMTGRVVRGTSGDADLSVPQNRAYALLAYSFFKEGENVVSVKTDAAAGIASVKAVKISDIAGPASARDFGFNVFKQPANVTDTRTLTITEDGEYKLISILNYQCSFKITLTDSLGVVHTANGSGRYQIGESSTSMPLYIPDETFMLKSGAVTVSLTGTTASNYYQISGYLLVKVGDYVEPVSTYTVKNFENTAETDGRVSAEVELAGADAYAAVMAAYDGEGNLLKLSAKEKSGYTESVSLAMTLSESERAAYSEIKVFAVNEEELTALLAEAAERDAMLETLAEDIRAGFRYDTRNGVRVLIVSDEHYCIDTLDRVGPLTGKTYSQKFKAVNGYATGHNNYGYGSEERLQLLIDCIKEEYKNGKIDAVMVLGDMTDMDHWGKYVSQDPSKYLDDTNGDGKITFDDIYKSPLDEMYYVKTEYYDQLLSFDSDGDGTHDASVPSFFTIGNHDVYKPEWFFEVFGYGAEIGVEKKVNDKISLYFVSETDYAVLFNVEGEKDTAFLMLNAFNNYDRYMESQGTASAHTTIKISQSFPESLEETNRLVSELLAYASDYRQIYIGAHYYAEKMWVDALKSSSKVRAIYIGDAHTETDTSTCGIPMYIDGAFYHTFQKSYNFGFNFASEPLSYMMLETYGDTAKGYRVHPETEYDIQTMVCPYYTQSVKEETDKVFGTNGIYSAMSAKEYALACFAYTIDAMASKGGAWGYLGTPSGERLTATLDTSTGVVTVTDESGNVYDYENNGIYFYIEYCRYVLNGSTVNSGHTKNGTYDYLADETRIAK